VSNINSVNLCLFHYVRDSKYFGFQIVFYRKNGAEANEKLKVRSQKVKILRLLRPDKPGLAMTEDGLRVRLGWWMSNNEYRIANVECGNWENLLQFLTLRVRI
jgi:hypothetical protein